MCMKAILIIAGAWLAVACSNSPRAGGGTENVRRTDVTARALSAGAFDEVGGVTMTSGIENWRMEASAAPVR